MIGAAAFGVASVIAAFSTSAEMLIATRALLGIAGATLAPSPAEVAAKAERTICMVETTAQAEAVIAGERGIIHLARAGHIVACMSTIDPFVARRLAEQLAARGIAMVDAPVSGGTERAASGELSIIVGGDAQTVAACQDLFRAMGKNVFHMGGLGQGLAMKLVNNMLSVAALAITSEGMVMGVKAGLDPLVMLDVINASSGRNSATESKFPVAVLNRTFEYGSQIHILMKDADLAIPLQFTNFRD